MRQIISLPPVDAGFSVSKIQGQGPIFHLLTGITGPDDDLSYARSCVGHMRFTSTEAVSGFRFSRTTAARSSAMSRDAAEEMRFRLDVDTSMSSIVAIAACWDRILLSAPSVCP